MLLRLGFASHINVPEHPVTKALHGRLMIRTHLDLRLSYAVLDNVMYEAVEPVMNIKAQHLGELSRDVFLGYESGPDGIIHVMIEIGYLI